MGILYTQRRADHQGSLMLITLMFLTALAVFASTFLFSVISNQRVTSGQVNTKKAFYMAEAGIDKAIYYLLHEDPDGNTGGVWRPDPPLTEYWDDADHAQGSYTMSVSSSGSTITINSVGTYQNISQALQRKITLGAVSGPQFQLDLDSLSGGTTANSGTAGIPANVVGAPAVVSGRTGNALHVSSGNYLNLGGGLDSAYSNITLSAWVRRNGDGGTETLIARGARADADGIGLMLISGKPAFGHDDSYVATGPDSIADNEWHLVTGVMEKNDTTYSYKVYVDGRLAGYAPESPTGLTTTTGDWTVGAASDGSEPLTGDLDEARVYTRALSAAEIKDLYEQGLGLVGWWRLDDGAGTLAVDSSIYGNNGTLMNSPTWGSGQISGSLSFNGTNNYIQTENIATGVTNFTYSVWIKPDFNQTYAGGQEPLIDWADASSNAPRLYMRLENGNTLYVDAGNGGGSTLPSAQFYWDGQALVMTGTTQATTPNYSAGTWHLVTLTGTTDNDVSGKPVILGWGSGTHPSRYFDGALDDARVYSTALTASEVARIYQEGMPTGLKAWWRLDDGSGTSASDSTGNANTGTLYNTPSWVSGHVGTGALSFDGTARSVRHPQVVTPDIAAFTMTAWAMPRTVPASEYSVHWHGGSQGEAALSIDGNTQRYQFRTKVFPPQSWYSSSSEEALSLDQWVLLTGVFRWGDSIELYVNGELSSSTAIPELNLFTPEEMTPAIGAYINAFESKAYFDGMIDDVRYYDRALSSAEVRSLYDDASLIAWWKFDEGEGTVAADSSGHGHAGTLVNNPSWGSGKIGSGALAFNGTDNYVTIPSADELNATTYTLSLWVNGQAGSSGTLLSKHADCAAQPYELSIGVDIASGCPKLWSGRDASAYCYGPKDGPSDAPVLDNAWHHLAATKAPDQSVKVYVDGVLKTTFDGTVVGSVSNDNPVWIGAAFGGWRYFSGSIDDVRIYNRALSDDDILRLYEEGGVSSGSSTAAASVVADSWESQ